ncbi:MAG TPA: hypothetical protein VJN65_08560 [Bacteroidota bacterium]|nr:hypothetical protein [Bacteroidota bacterium]
MDWHKSSSLQLVINDLNEIAADAYRHRIRTRAKKGGNGVYDTSNGGFVFLLPRRHDLNQRARFEVVKILPDAIVLKAVSLEDPACFLKAIVDGRGQLTHIEFPTFSGFSARPSPSEQHQTVAIVAPPSLSRLLKVYEDL